MRSRRSPLPPRRFPPGRPCHLPARRVAMRSGTRGAVLGLRSTGRGVRCPGRPRGAPRVRSAESPLRLLPPRFCFWLFGGVPSPSPPPLRRFGLPSGRTRSLRAAVPVARCGAGVAAGAERLRGYLSRVPQPPFPPLALPRCAEDPPVRWRAKLRGGFARCAAAEGGGGVASSASSAEPWGALFGVV